MKLEIKNFAKIGNVVIENEGMTVIAGVNNIGKSTFGKVVFALVDSLSNIGEKIEKEKIDELYKACNNVIGNFLSNRKIMNGEKMIPSFIIRRLSAHFVEGIRAMGWETVLSSKEIELILDNNLLAMGIELDREDKADIVEFVRERLKLIRNLSDMRIAQEIVNRNFSDVFNGQINNLNATDEEAVVELTINGKKCLVKFVNHECTFFESDLVIMNDVYFIDNPFIIDSTSRNCKNKMEVKIVKRAILAFENNDDGVIGSVIAKEKLGEIDAVLDKVLEGNINLDNFTNGFQLQTDKYEEPLRVGNLSTGLKSFVIIKLLLEKGILKSEDILILDEPEVHLHPEWQQVYAQIIVLLQKYFDMKIIITTHSSNFLEAIEYYSKKNKLYDKCGFYLAKIQDDRSYYDNVTSDASAIYRQMVESSIRLERLNYEMEEENGEQ